MQKKYVRLLALWIGTSLLPSMAAAGLLNKLVEGTPKRIELSEQADPQQAFQQAFSGNGAFSKTVTSFNHKVRRIIVAGFQAEFATEQKGINKGLGAGTGLASSVETVYSLRGTQDQQLQALTDNMHAAYLQLLVARGYEVLPASLLQDSAYKDKMLKINQPPVHHERGAAMELLFGNTEKEIDNASVIATAKGTSSAVFDSSMLGNMSAFKVADSLNAHLVHVRVKVNFARFEESGWFMPGVDDKPQNTIGTRGTYLQIFSPGGAQTNYPLVNTIVLPGKLAEQALPVEASTAQTTQRATGGAVRALTGFLKGGLNGAADIAGGAIGSSHSVMASSNFAIDAPSNYEALMTQDLTLMNKVLAESFAK